MSSRRTPQNPDRRPGRSRYGTPGESINRERKRLLRAYRALPFRTKTAAVTLIALLIGSAGYAVSGEWGAAATAAAIAAAVATGLAVVLSHPGVAMTAAVVVVYWFIAAGASGATFVFAATNSRAAAENGIVLAVLLGPLVAVLAHLTSRGRPWVTTGLALLSATTIGLLLLYAFPSAGFWLAILTSGAVLFLRGGGWEWFVDTAYSVTDRVRPSQTATPVAGAVLQARQESAVRTAELFDELGQNWVALHDVAVPTGRRQRFRREHKTVEHVLIGPGGVVVVTSRLASGTLRDHNVYGIALNGAPIAPAMLRLSQLRDAVAKAMRLEPDSVGAVIVLHGARIEDGRMRVGLYDSKGDPLGESYAVNEASLVAEVLGRPELWTSGQVRAMVRRARAALPPATTSGLLLLSNAEEGAGSYKRGGFATTDADNEDATPVEIDDSGPPLWFRSTGGDDTPRPLIVSSDNAPVTKVGQKATLMTEEGMFEDMRVVSEPYMEDDVLLVLVCTEREWQDATRNSSRVNGYPFPLASVLVA